MEKKKAIHRIEPNIKIRNPSKNALQRFIHFNSIHIIQ